MPDDFVSEYSVYKDLPTRSDFFVAREEEMDKFAREFLAYGSSFRVFAIDTKGEGGIGKTQLLLHMQGFCSLCSSANTMKLIDFYHHESRDKIGVMEQIASGLGLANFPNFFEQLKSSQETQDVAKRQRVVDKLQKIFHSDYSVFCRSKAKAKEIVVLYFDSYEHIQKTSKAAQAGDSTIKEADNTNFSTWLETVLFADLADCDNARLVIAGRYQPIGLTGDIILRDSLVHFQLDDTKLFLEGHFSTLGKGEEKLPNKLIISDSHIEKIHDLANGKPIFLALFVDWVKYSKSIVPAKLIEDLLKSIGESPVSDIQQRKYERKRFERKLIENIEQLLLNYTLPSGNVYPVHALTLLAAAYHRVTIDILSVLTDGAPLDDCKAAIETLKPWSFIKQKENNVILLHDEMRRLLDEYYWKNNPTALEVDRKLLIKYYEEELLPQAASTKTTHNLLFSELLEYAFDVSLSEGLERFCIEFDLAMDDGEYHYADLLLREAENYIPSEPAKPSTNFDFLKIELRRIRYDTDTDANYQNALKKAEAVLERYQEHPRWEHSDIKGQFLLSKGAAEFWLANYDHAVESFKAAKQIFTLFGKDYWANLAINWIGYAYYRQARFSDARSWLHRSQEGFQTLLARLHTEPDDKQKELKHRQILQAIQLAFGNLAMVDFYTRRFYNAATNASITLHIVRSLPRNSKETARSLNAFSLTMNAIGHGIEARQHVSEADELLEEIDERVVTGRVKLNLFWQKFHEKAPPYPFEYYRAEELKRRIAKLALRDKAGEFESLLKEAIEMLENPSPIMEGLAGAYLALSELYLLTPSFEQSERMLKKGLYWAKASKFKYHEIYALKNLVRLYYLMAPKEEYDKKAEPYKNLLAQYMNDSTAKDYAELFARYEITLGNAAFDNALDTIRKGFLFKFFEKSPVMRFLEEGFEHYASAAKRLKNFNEKNYHLVKVIVHKRLRTFIELTKGEKFAANRYLEKLNTAWQGDADFGKIFEYTYLSISPQDKLEQIYALEERLSKATYDRKSANWVALQADCLISAFRSLLQQEKSDYRASLIDWHVYNARFNRRIGNHYKANSLLQTAEAELKELERIRFHRDQAVDRQLPIEIKSLGAWINATQGTLLYRQAEYRDFVEFYLREELDETLKEFSTQFANSLERLQGSEDILEQTANEWEELKTKTLDASGKQDILKRARKDTDMLRIIRFWIGELLMLNKKFDKDNENIGALRYLELAVQDAEKLGSFYGLANAMESYINAKYFRDDKTTDKEHKQQRMEYERKLEQMPKQVKEEFPDIFGKLRIVQGDRLFSSYFRQDILHESPDYRFVPRDPAINIPKLREMLGRYLQACDFMAQIDDENFFKAIRVLFMRIRMIGHKNTLEELRRALRLLWRDQPHLQDRNRKGELWTLNEYIQIMQDIITHEK